MHSGGLKAERMRRKGEENIEKQSKAAAAERFSQCTLFLTSRAAAAADAAVVDNGTKSLYSITLFLHSNAFHPLLCRCCV
jgi:hypothetical protein